MTVKRINKSSLDQLVKNYIKFINSAKTSHETIIEANKILKAKKFFNNPNHLSFYNIDETAFALFKPGKKSIEEGLRIVYSHVDSPCLQVLLSEPLRETPQGIGLPVIPYGGIGKHQWVGTDIEVRGFISKNRRRRLLKFDVLNPDVSMHVDSRIDDEIPVSDAFNVDDILLLTGFKTENTLLKYLGFKDREDFTRARLYAVPKVKATLLPANNLIKGYGHDDRSSTFTGLDAFLSCIPEFPVMFIGFDKEEIGSDGDGGAKGKFFEQVLYDTICNSLGIKLRDLNLGLVEEVIRHSYAISADGDAGLSNLESNSTIVNTEGIGRSGEGTIFLTHDGGSETMQVPAKIIDKFLRILQENKIKYQTTACTYNSDNLDGDGNHADYLINRGIPTGTISAPIIGLHSQCELIHTHDLYWMREAYKAFFNDRKS